MIEVIYKNKEFQIQNKPDFQSLNSKGFGIFESNNFYLNIYEVLYLLERKKIKVFKNKLDFDFDMILKKTKIELKVYLIYKDLKSKGYVVLSGSKYGFTFRIYDKGIKLGQDHSLWLIEPVLDRDKILFKDILGKNRIAHGSNKKLIFAVIDSENSITYIENNWKRL